MKDIKELEKKYNVEILKERVDLMNGSSWFYVAIDEKNGFEEEGYLVSDGFDLKELEEGLKTFYSELEVQADEI